MTKTEKLNAAIKHLSDISAEWDERDVDNYPDNSPTFDEIITCLLAVEFTKFRPADWVQLKVSSRVGKVLSVNDVGVKIAFLIDDGDFSKVGSEFYWVKPEDLCRYDQNCDEYCCADCGAIFADGEKRDDHYMTTSCHKRQV